MEFNGTFLATIITFILFVIVMNKVLYVPILRIMEERKTFIDENYKCVTENNLKADDCAKEKESKLLGAKNQAREVYLETLDKYKEQKKDVVSEAQDNAAENLSNSALELENLSNEVKAGLKNRMIDLANDIVEKVLGYRSEVENFDNDKVDEVLYK